MTDETVEAAYCTREGVDAVTLFGMTINNLSLDELLETIAGRIEAREPGYILTPNVDHVIDFQHHEEFRAAYHHGTLAIADGTLLVWASHLLGKPIQRKISGSDLIYWLTEYAAEKGYSIFFMGAAEGVAAEAAEILAAKYPGLKIAGTYCPPMGFDKDPDEDAKVVAAVRDAKPDICYVALGAPKQDLWSYHHHRETGVPIHIGVGASFDFVTGKLQRAPKWMCDYGLEWAWRMVQEPRRLGHRYLIKDFEFWPLLWREYWKPPQG